MFIDGISLGIGFCIGIVICASVIGLLALLFIWWFVYGKDTP